MFLMKGYTLREAAQALGVSIVTIRRYIKSGKLKARLVPSKFGESYIIEDLPLPTKPLSDDTQQVQPLITSPEWENLIFGNYAISLDKVNILNRV